MTTQEQNLRQYNQMEYDKLLNDYGKDLVSNFYESHF